MGSVGIQSFEIPVSDEKPNTRPLNSFFAFRAYYTAIFSVIQQKERSGLLTQLWKAPDPFQAKWAIIAKAYSVIRSLQGKNFSNVQEFLSFTAPFMDIIEPEKYLEQLGYVVYAPENEHGYTIVHEYEPQFDLGLTESDKSVLDIVKNAIDHGYVRVNEESILKKAASESMLISPGQRKGSGGRQGTHSGNDSAPVEVDIDALLAMIPEGTKEEREALMKEIMNCPPRFMPSHDERTNETSAFYDLQDDFQYDLEFIPATENMFLDPYSGYRFNAYNIEEHNSMY